MVKYQKEFLVFRHVLNEVNTKPYLIGNPKRFSSFIKAANAAALKIKTSNG